MIDPLLQALAQYGPLGIFAGIFVWMYIQKDKQIEETRAQCHKEILELYKEAGTLVLEVSKALQDKSSSDHALSEAIEKLADRIEEISKNEKR